MSGSQPDGRAVHFPETGRRFDGGNGENRAAVNGMDPTGGKDATKSGENGMAGVVRQRYLGTEEMMCVFFRPPTLANGWVARYHAVGPILSLI
jgi:hypothetical protein